MVDRLWFDLLRGLLEWETQRKLPSSSPPDSDGHRSSPYHLVSLVIRKAQVFKKLELLYFLASSPNQVFTREQLLDHIWGYEYIGDTRTVDVHVKRLREKIKDHASWSIATVWGIGYKFEVSE